MVDGPEFALPDFGPYALRFNMATLWLAVEEQRVERELSWDLVADQTRYLDVEHIRRQCYGIAMHDLMNVVRWLRRPAALFLYPSGLAPARPGSATYGGPEKAAAESSAPDLGQVYLAGTRGRSDQDIAAFALSRGGFANICYTILMSLRLLPPTDDYELGMDLGEGLTWTVRSRDGRTSFAHRMKKTARCRMEAAPADFMRLVFQELDPDAAVSSGRVRVDGDPEPLRRLFRSFAVALESPAA